MPPRRVLISEPNASGEEYPYLPYMWAVLKTYWDHHGSDPEAFTWLEPIYNLASVEADLARCDQPPDVLGLSCYVWNRHLQSRIAAWAKARNPGCLVVAGGPDPDFKNPDFFRDNPCVDIVVVKDGEVPFTNILEAVLRGERDFRDIPGLYLPRPAHAIRWPQDGGPHLHTGPTAPVTDFDRSPYLEHADVYERIVSRHRPGKINAIWETNRGCPYSCSFCDWGSATMSKVRRFEMSRIVAEADWIARIGIDFLFITDANFGILERDIELAEHLAAARGRYGRPRAVYYAAAKNNPDRTIEIAKRFHAAGFIRAHILAVQHTNREVLAATDRSNISTEKYRQVVSTLAGFGIPSEVQLIIGIPGDTPDRWRSCFADLMDWGVHDSYSVYPYQLLPNAPAGDPKFLEEWRVETIDRWVISPAPQARRSKTTPLERFAQSKVIVASRTYTRDDWAQMMVFAAFVKAYHNRSLTRLPAMYLYFVHGVSYREFYDALVDEFAAAEPFMRAFDAHMRSRYERFLADPEASDEFELDDVPGYGYYVDASRWLFVNTCRRIDEFYDRLGDFLTARYPHATHLRSAIAYQKDLVILPDYDCEAGKRFTTDRHWPEFFRTASRLTRHEPLAEPPALDPGTELEVRERVCGARTSLAFGAPDAGAGERWTRWVEQNVRGSNAAYVANFSEVTVVPSQVAAGSDLHPVGLPT